MGLEKVGETIGKEIVAWTRTSGKSLLTTKPVKVNTCGLRYTHELKSDIFLPTSLTKKTEVGYRTVHSCKLQDPRAAGARS